MALLGRIDDDIDSYPTSPSWRRRQHAESASSGDRSRRGGQGRRRQRHRRPAHRPAVRAEMVDLVGGRPGRPPQRRRAARLHRPADPRALAGSTSRPHPPGLLQPASMFDTSDSARAAQTARAQTAGAVAVVADPNSAASYGTIPGFTGLPAGATTTTSPRSWSAWSSAPSAQGRPAPHVVGQAFATRRRAGYRLSTMDRLPIPYGGTAASVRRGGLRAMPEATAASHPHPHKAPRLGPRSTA